MDTQLNVLSTRRGFWGVRLPKSQQGSNRGFPLLRGKTVILQFRPDEGVSDLVVDRIGVNYRNLPRRAGFLKHRLEPGTSASKSGGGSGSPTPTGITRTPALHGIQLAVGPQPLRIRNHNSGLAHRIMVKRLATSPHDSLGITDSACKNQLVVVSVQFGPFNPYIPIRSTTIGKSRVAIDPIAMHTSWRSNSDIASVSSIGYPRMSASGESSTTMHRLLHASGSHPIPMPYDPK
ncbi:hypothetical protein F511_34621 [Dorcoceras hygrometricum]|uniref:Uncharacterized protein n=1 Tax=Dorcoceras hygrometricum TaxID=472368 RepID=A0A2Z7CFS6_9LAMI|nr:hypothetical protein F511_34621 [Dorcoceras hygrometricum]